MGLVEEAMGNVQSQQIQRVMQRHAEERRRVEEAREAWLGGLPPDEDNPKGEGSREGEGFPER